MSEEKIKQETICPGCGVTFKGKSGRTCGDDCEQYMIDTFIRGFGAKYHREINDGGTFNFPDGLMRELGWEKGDLLQLEKSEVLEDDGNDHPGITISNLTKNKQEKIEKK